MTTKRTPIQRPPRHTLPAEAIAIFKHMQKLSTQCTCKEPERGEYWKRQTCPACLAWGDEASALHKVLRLKPWQDVDEMFDLLEIASNGDQADTTLARP